MRARGMSRSGLFLMELILVILFFAISAAICLRVFASARQTAERGHDLSCAVLAAQSAAECYRASGGDLETAADLLSGNAEEGGLAVAYDAVWQRTAEAEPEYRLELVQDGACADITVRKADAAEPIYTLRIRIPGGDGA
jgi:type II secretory pathway pseudopilin PulG